MIGLLPTDEYIETWTKWHLKAFIFLNENYWILFQISLNESALGSGNGLTVNRWRAITWAND